MTSRRLLQALITTQLLGLVIYTHPAMVFCSPAYGDMWVLEHANGFETPVWSNWSTSGVPPSGRRAAAVAWDPQGDRLFVVGGRVPCSTVLADAFVLFNAGGAPGVGPNWHPLGDGASPPLPAMTGAKGAYGFHLDRFLSFGGLEADGSSIGQSSSETLWGGA